MANVFLPITYTIEHDWQGAKTKQVRGYAFETPGWPEFHACVRHDKRNPWDVFNEWILDHFETGKAIGEVKLARREEAPEALRRLLDGKGKEKVHNALKKAGAPW